MKANTVPIPTPLATSASAIGKVSKISAYMGMSANVATNTEKRFFTPRIAVMMFYNASKLFLARWSFFFYCNDNAKELQYICIIE